MRIKNVLLSLFVVNLCACAPTVFAPVEERSIFTERQQIQKFGGHLIRMVKSGDTLYGIAFESNLSVRKLAAWNGIENYRSLKVGQRLRLTKPVGFVEKKKPSNVVAKVAKASSQRQTRARNKKSTLKSAEKNTVTKISKATQANVKAKVPVKTTAPPKKPQSNSAWVWPVKGSVLRTFSSKNGRQGIDIAVARGTPVVAARPGEVVYVGNSLKGYGNLIIIKHNGDFLSAYAHNAKTMVKEGQMIAAKHKIGISGLNNRGEPALQFQIRIDGNSVNPLPYLRGK